MSDDPHSLVGPSLLRRNEVATQLRVFTSIPNIRMQQFIKIARGLSSPAILIVAVWCATLIGVAVGPVDYPLQPSVPVLVLVATGVSLFIVAHQGGGWYFRVWLRHRPNLPAPSVRTLNIAVATASMLGLTGIALIALDRMFLTGASSGGYAELLRCAPVLADFIEIKRTPLIYVGYLTFSFGFAALALFLLKGEEIRGWTAILAQLSILSPVGYALLYSGRMPILFVIVLIVAAVLVRVGEGRSPLPHGHYLLVKMIVFVVLFGIYSNAMWSSRRDFCVQTNDVVRELLAKMQARDTERARAREAQRTELRQESQRPYEMSKSSPGNSEQGAEIRQEAANETAQARGQGPATETGATGSSPSSRPEADVNATDLNAMIAKTARDTGKLASSDKLGELLGVMQNSWHVRPRDYVLRAIESGRLSPDAAKSLLSTYFYLTHGVRIIDVTWQARSQFSPHWGIYEIGILSPILRVFFPQNELLASMSTQLKSSEILGFFPTVWAAAYIDFGAAGAVVYVLIWGFAAGWSAVGARRSVLALPALLLTFILASILLSPVQGPLGIANSALVLVSMVVVGLAIDLESLRASSRREPRKLVEPEAPV